MSKSKKGNSILGTAKNAALTAGIAAGSVVSASDGKLSQKDLGRMYGHQQRQSIEANKSRHKK